MRKISLALLGILCLNISVKASYTDHRFHNVDSLEAVMAGWTAMDIEKAGEEELKHLVKDLDELMYGCLNTNSVKSEYYARMMLGIAKRMAWPEWECAAAKTIGQHFWHKEQFDSAAFYYRIAMDAVERIPATEPTERDNSLSSMYGTLGNLYSMMDSIDTAMDYYIKAGEIFKAQGWHNSSATLYYNMGETMRNEDALKEAEKYYHESLKYARLADDSLAVATACKGLGSLYLDMGRTAKAMRYLNDANIYFAQHEDEELQFRMESLDYTGQVLALQKKHLTLIIILFTTLILLAASTYFVIKGLRRTKQEKAELTEVMDETVETLSNAPKPSDILLKPREKEILDLIAKGYTNPQIAEALCLSPETIKWYKRKLFALFDASNSAELVRIVKERGLI